MSKYLLTLVSLGLGLASLYTLFHSCTLFKPREFICFSSEQSLREIEGYDWLLHPFGLPPIPGIDNLLCLLTPVFNTLIELGDLGMASYLFVLQPFLAFLIFAAIESLRKGARAFVLWVPVVLLLGQLISVGAAVPLLWLPSWFLGPNRLTVFTAKNRPGYLSGSDGIFIVAFCAWWVTIVIPLVPLGMEEFRFVWINLFQFAPLIVFLNNFYLYLNGYTDDLEDITLASETASKLYKFYAAILALTNFGLIYLIYSSKLTLDFFLSTKPDSPESVALIFFIDGITLILSLGLFTLSEDGFFGFLRFFGLSLAIGPGSTFLILAIKREEDLMKKLLVFAKNEKTKKE